MTGIPAVLASGGLALMLGGCGSSPAVDKIAIEKAVNAVEKDILKAANEKDAGSFAAHYASNAVMMTPGEPAMKGSDGIAAGLKPMLADPAFKLDFAADRTEVADSGEMAATRGSYTLSLTDPATKKVVNDKGSYVTLFRKQTDGAWKAVFDINTSEVPPPVAEPKADMKKAAGKKPEAKKKGRKK